jgi:transposase
MLAMPKINYIKHLREIESKNITEIAKLTEIDWKTAKKYADNDQVPEVKIKKKRGMMYQGKWGQIVLDWIDEDRSLKRKNRRNATLLYEGLVEMGFEGSYRTVCQYIQDNDKNNKASESYERMDQPPGEAQVDFGHTEAVMEGSIVDSSCLVMSPPYSNGAHSIPMPAENQECFLQGLIKLFRLFQGVPRAIRIDNLKAAVIISRGQGKEAVLTDEFMMFAHYYGFQVQVCNPYSAHEKGHVENKVGYVRNNMLTPAPVVKDYEELEEYLHKKNLKDHERKHYRKGVKIKELLEEEKKYFLELPDQDYPVFREETARVNKYGEVTIDSKKIYIPKSNRCKRVKVIYYWDKYEVYAPSGNLLHTDFRSYMRKKRNIPWKDILKGWSRKPRVVTYSRHTPYLPERVKSYLTTEDFSERKSRIKQILGFLEDRNMQDIEEDFYYLISSKDIEFHDYNVDWQLYDSLAKDS